MVAIFGYSDYFLYSLYLFKAIRGGHSALALYLLYPRHVTLWWSGMYAGLVYPSDLVLLIS